MIELAGWGRYPRHETEWVEASTPAAVPDLLAGQAGIVARGNGRAYGDAAIGERITLSTGRLDRFRAFDPATGRLTVEAGVLLADILTAFVARGFFPPVVPGTKFVTVGGMGLTGTIMEATFRLRAIETGWLRQRTIVAGDLDAAMAALQETAGATYSVAWIDCLARGASLGRSLVYAAEHATREEIAALRPGAEPFPLPRQGRLAVPLDMPAGMLNRASVRAFNELYFRRGAMQAGDPFLVHWDPYFFPLDWVGDWNRIYGRRGFLQYQCVIPSASARQALGEIVERISRRGSASFLAVLKQLGDSSGLVSFPMPGFTLALDLPVTSDVLSLLDELDRVVVEAGGRLYLAKDSRQSPATFESGYPGLAAFRAVRRAIGANGRIASRLSSRLGI